MTQIHDLQATHAQELQRVGFSSSSNAAIARLRAELDQANSAGARLTTQHLDLADFLSRVMVSCTLSMMTSSPADDVLETQFTNSRVFSPGALLDFLHDHTTLDGHWQRLLELLTAFQESQTVPSSYRTTLTVSDRDQVSDDCGSYLPLAASTPVVGSHTATPQVSAQPTAKPPSPVPNSGTARARTPLGSARVSPVRSEKQRRKPLSVPMLSSSLTPGGLRKAGSAAPRGASPSVPTTIDLARSVSSTPKSKR